jgi:hypothetical protein
MTTDERLYRFFREHEDARPKWLFIEPDGRYRLMLACWHLFHWKDSDDVFREGLTMALLRWLGEQDTIGIVGPSQVDGTWMVGVGEGGRTIGTGGDLLVALLDAAEAMEGDE